MSDQPPFTITPAIIRLIAEIGETLGRLSMLSEQAAALGLRDRKSFRERYLRPALKAGPITMTLPDKPNSRWQRYRLTATGRAAVASA